MESVGLVMRGEFAPVRCAVSKIGGARSPSAQRLRTHASAGERTACRLSNSSHFQGVLPSRLLLSARSPTNVRARQAAVVVRSRRGDTVPAADRVLAAVPYLLPFLDGARYARYLYQQYPFTRPLLDPLIPLVQTYNAVPFAGFAVFFALYLGVIRNQNLDRYVRFNAMQAVILDILMILPSLFERLLAPRDPISYQLTVILYNTVFLYLLACFVFGVVSCLLGKTPRLPLVADAADAQVPF